MNKIKKAWKKWHGSIEEMTEDPNPSFIAGFLAGQDSLESEIVAWHKKAFPHANKKEMIEKLREETLELAESIRSSNIDEIMEEAVDVYIVAVAMSNREYLMQLRDAITHKLGINKKRKWNSDGSRDK